MKIIAQPENYSDVLERVFYSTLAMGVLCTFALAAGSPEVANLLSRVPTEAELGPLKQLKLLYVVVPLVIAFASRIVKLHDRISDLFRLRRRIDTQWILIPLAVGVGIKVDEATRKILTMKRVVLMRDVFYPYVTLPDAKIDHQLVRTALDSLGWMWSLLEASLLFGVTTALLAALHATTIAAWWSGLTIAFVLATLALWAVCKRNSTAEVQAILSDSTRRDEVRVKLNEELEKPTATERAPIPKTTAGATMDIFISHAFEDKDAIARPLYEALTAAGISVWFDEASLKLGDSLREKIDEGLATCRYGVVILSSNFFSKPWSKNELAGLFARETSSRKKAILPIWHDINAATIAKYSPLLADRVAVHSRLGIPKIVSQIKAVLEDIDSEEAEPPPAALPDTRRLWLMNHGSRIKFRGGALDFEGKLYKADEFFALFEQVVTEAAKNENNFWSLHNAVLQIGVATWEHTTAPSCLWAKDDFLRLAERFAMLEETHGETPRRFWLEPIAQREKVDPSPVEFSVSHASDDVLTVRPKSAAAILRRTNFNGPVREVVVVPQLGRRDEYPAPEIPKLARAAHVQGKRYEMFPAFPLSGAGERLPNGVEWAADRKVFAFSVDGSFGFAESIFELSQQHRIWGVGVGLLTTMQRAIGAITYASRAFPPLGVRSAQLFLRVDGIKNQRLLFDIESDRGEVYTMHLRDVRIPSEKVTLGCTFTTSISRPTVRAIALKLVDALAYYAAWEGREGEMVTIAREIDHILDDIRDP